jgi:hypothetical protein
LEAQLKEAQAKLARLKLKINISFGFSCTFRKSHNVTHQLLAGQSQSYAALSLRPAKAGNSFSRASPHDVGDDHASQFLDEKPLITVKELVQVSGPILKQYPPRGTSDPTLKNWLQQFPAETRVRQNVSRCSGPIKAKFQEAAIQYGLPMEQGLKFPLEVFSSSQLSLQR